MRNLGLRLFLVGVAVSYQTTATPPHEDSYGKLPLSFETNAGQTARDVNFLARGNGYRLFLTAEEAILAASDAAVLTMRMAGSRRAKASPVGEEPLPGTANYLIGNDPSQWHTGLLTYARVRYPGIYPGVDLIFYGNSGQLEYDFVIAPGADAKSIRLRFSGANQLRFAADCNLIASSAGGTVTLRKPMVYQIANGRREPVTGDFTMRAGHTVGFRLGNYDHAKPLVIDPVLVYSTYLGGSASDSANAIAADSEGNAFIAGYAESTDLPITQGAFQTTNNAQSYSYSAFVTKLNADGTAALYSTYIGGTVGDVAYAVTVDGSGNAYIAGATVSSNFPTTTSPLQAQPGPGFVSKLNPSGSALVYSTYFGGYAGGLAADSSGSLYMTGNVPALSTTFTATPGAFQTVSKSCCGPFVSSPFVAN